MGGAGMIVGIILFLLGAMVGVTLMACLAASGDHHEEEDFEKWVNEHGKRK
jgi:hypothetical protein